MRWFFALMRADLDFIILVDIATLQAAWSYYKDGRLFDAARVLSATAEEEARIIVLGQAEADALEQKHPRGVWLGGCPEAYGVIHPVRLYVLLGLEGSRSEEEMRILPGSRFGPHGELLRITGELLQELSLEVSDVL